MIIKCPECKGFKFSSLGWCSICDGQGTVDDEHVCECGRPAIKFVRGTWVCVSLECQNDAMKNEYVNITKIPKVTVVNEDLSEFEMFGSSTHIF